ncbi:biotin-dependent carboxyltransferase family protein [Pedobacter sp. KBS0701]|uniref:5-oxoprolinase subunit C family protein n=1 Tax=unclassified Pedobacter TaxID=2628915 RepID=UPI00110F4F3E|nr:biotin-dependent carboxyltransferase family protein [Pedobacter sp. KBS0701]QDW24991.1 biotin-dependent carboxyltransferase family protein [Pedobacter sp. KBS0701]
MKISIIKPGLLSTIQDMGRYRYLSQAVPVSGAMDELAHRLANKAVGNDDNDATIEFTYADASFKAETPILISYSGDGAFLVYNNELMPAEKPLFFSKGSVIKLMNNSIGVRTYLAVAGGWDVPDVMESKSTYLTAAFGGFKGRALQKADVLVSGPVLSEISNRILSQLIKRSSTYPNWRISRESLLPEKRQKIRVILANEISWFDATSIISFLTNTYTIDLRSNRMGYHLSGKPLVKKVKKELLSTAVTPGIIQVTGSGHLVILLADCQTTGGYPRIAHVAAVDLPLCAQLKPGDEIQFSEISRDEAEGLYLERERDLSLITMAISLKYTKYEDDRS